MTDKDNEIKELKERLNKLEGTQSAEQEKSKEEDKPGFLANFMTFVIFICIIVWFNMDDSESPASNEVAKEEIKETPKIDINDQYRSQITTSLAKQNFNSYWGQDSSLWIENPGNSKSDLETFGYKLCDLTKNSGINFSYTITFWQSLSNGPRGQILKVRCF